MKRTIMIATVIIIGICAAAAGNLFAATFDTIEISATIAAGTSSVAITEATIAFGTLTGSETDHRFSAGPMSVSYFAASSPWTIRVFTDNSPGSGKEPEKAGFKGADGTTFVPLKVWNANYGPSGSMPDPEVDLNWIGTAPAYDDVRWLRIPEKDEHTADPYSWRRLAYNGAELPSPFVNYLGVDAQGAKPQAYTTTLTIEIINQ